MTRRGLDTAEVHRCTRHRRYRMDCRQYAELKARAGGSCEVCGIPEPTRILHIDHDHRVGPHAVRGLACPPCNQMLRWIDRGAVPSDAFRQYLQRPIWRQWYEPEPHRAYRTMEPDGELVWQWWFPVPPDEVWQQVLAKSADTGVSISEIVRQALEEWVK